MSIYSKFAIYLYMYILNILITIQALIHIALYHYYIYMKNIAILWYGVEWRSTYKFLTETQWISPESITILDKNINIELPSECMANLGEEYLVWLETYDEIWRSPGMTDHHIQEVLPDRTKRASIIHKLTSQTNYFFEHTTSEIIGVTGTKGKSTTVSFLLTLLSQGPKSVVLAGNIGIPVFDTIDFADQPDIVIYEISSYMLESLPDTTKIDHWVLTSMSEAHVWSHGSLEKYYNAKIKLLDLSHKKYISHQAFYSELIPHDLFEQLSKDVDKLVYIYGPQWNASFFHGHFEYKQKTVCDDNSFKPLGEHMRWNVCVWLLMLKINGLKKIDFQKALKLYDPLPHRLESIGTYKGINWINDSFATTGNSVAACVRSLWDDLETIFLWGYDNNADPSEIVEAIQSSQIKNIILFPTTGQRLKELLGDDSYTYMETNDITKAVQWAYKNTAEWKFAALSCGYPSFTMRDNYTHRGENFTEVVRSLSDETIK